MPKKLTQDEFLIKVTKENRNDIDYSDFMIMLTYSHG